jgi:hypothetical protein
VFCDGRGEIKEIEMLVRKDDREKKGSQEESSGEVYYREDSGQHIDVAKSNR